MSRFHNFSKRLSAVEPELNPDDEPDDDEDCKTDTKTGPKSKSKKKESIMDDNEFKAAIAAARAEGHEEGVSATIDRQNAVFASEHYPGREAQAAKMLTKPSMSADDIIDILADTPKSDKQGLSDDAARAAAEEAGRKEMREQLGKGKNSSVDADDHSNQASDHSAGWKKAAAMINKRNGL